MKSILLWLGLIKPASCENQKPILVLRIGKSTYPKNQPSQQDWMNEFRVSMLHGRKAVNF